MIEIKDIPLHQYIDRLKDNKYFSFVRYGDGEWKALWTNHGIVSCGLQPLSPKLYEDMRETLIENANSPTVIFGMQNLAVKLMGARIEEFLKQIRLQNISWINADVFHYASIHGTLFPLIKELRRKKVVIIGPAFLRKLLERAFDYTQFIEIPGYDCYVKKNQIMEAILKAHKEIKEDAIYSFSAGPATNILILSLHEKMPNNFLIDFGSLWDIFCGVRSRGYTRGKRYGDETLKRNLGG